MDRHFIRTAFFDESGTHLDSTVVVVGGYVASEDQWFMFRQEWEDMLHREGIPAIHRVSLENFRGNFARENGWRTSVMSMQTGGLRDADLRGGSIQDYLFLSDCDQTLNRISPACARIDLPR